MRTRQKLSTAWHISLLIIFHWIKLLIWLHLTLITRAEKCASVCPKRGNMELDLMSTEHCLLSWELEGLEGVKSDEWDMGSIPGRGDYLCESLESGKTVNHLGKWQKCSVVESLWGQCEMKEVERTKGKPGRGCHHAKPRKPYSGGRTLSYVKVL